MGTQLTPRDVRQSLTTHVTLKGAELHRKFGPTLTWASLPQLLADRCFVRYPCEITFDAAPLFPGEFAHPVPKGERPEDGFTIAVHPIYLLDLERVPFLVLYQLVAVNYGQFASADDAEAFGAAALGLSCDEYYAALCALADRLGEPLGDDGARGGSTGCSRRPK